MNQETDKPLIYERSNKTTKDTLKPVVLKYKSRKKKKQARRAEKGKIKYSRDLKEPQQTEADLVRFARRASRTVSKGLDTYERERNRSAHEKKDGAIEDFAQNSAKALSVSLKEASEIPLDLADSLSSKNFRKRWRSTLRRATKTLRVFRL